MTDYPYRDPNHPGNAVRPSVQCIGCGNKGCITAWGPWCFTCNVKRMDRINKALEPVSEMFVRASNETRNAIR